MTDAVGVSVTADVATVQGDTDNIQTRLPAALVGGAMDADVSAMQTGSISSGTIAAGELTNIENEIWNALKSAHVVANSFGDFLDIEVSGRSSHSAADVWTSGTRNLTALGFSLAETDFTTAALRQLGGVLFSGTADAGGSSTTIDDAALTEADDIWTGAWVLITSGTSANQCRLITNFDAVTDVLTFAPALSSSIGAGVTYEIYANAGVDVHLEEA